MTQFSRYLRIFLLLVFALLQGVAPVAHAHVGGHHQGHSVHLAELDSALPHDDGSAQLYAVPDHGAVVSMPPEYRAADLTIAQPVAGDEHLFALREYLLPPFPQLRRQALASPPYQHPFSQAPPA